MKKQWIILIGLMWTIGQAIAQEVPPQIQLKDTIENNERFKGIFTGFALFDPSDTTFLYQLNAEKYFTPASNTKILTLLTCLKTLGDSMPALLYYENEEDFVFWGTGDPSFLHPDLPVDTSALELLRSTPKNLKITFNNDKTTAFGPGWAWDDYYFTFQSERTPFPIYANRVTFRHQKGKSGVEAFPQIAGSKITLDATMSNRSPKFIRGKENNNFRCNTRAIAGNSYERTAPFHYSKELLAQLLSDTIGRAVQLVKRPQIVASEIKVKYSQIPIDTIYQKMVQKSDNFLAEQLLLTAANQALGEQQTGRIIEYAKKNYFGSSPDPLLWFDGSGLSRYNLFTPRSMVYLLNEIYQLLPFERIQLIFPAGGVSGTIKNWYANETGKSPYIFAKTGTLSNVHCLSGYLVTNSGKVLIFSFMHNNYPGSSKSVKQEMQPILEFIRDTF